MLNGVSVASPESPLPQVTIEISIDLRVGRKHFVVAHLGSNSEERPNKIFGFEENFILSFDINDLTETGQNLWFF